MTVPPVTNPPRFRAASEINARPVDWLWPGLLALGELAILEGDPGLGKSFLALDLCARLSNGRPWPDGPPAPAAASVYLSGEDSDEATVGPRLRPRRRPDPKNDMLPSIGLRTPQRTRPADHVSDSLSGLARRGDRSGRCARRR
jgi:hypothetical protein